MQYTEKKGIFTLRNKISEWGVQSSPQVPLPFYFIWMLGAGLLQDLNMFTGPMSTELLLQEVRCQVCEMKWSFRARFETSFLLLNLFWAKGIDLPIILMGVALLIVVEKRSSQ